jgi:hypothetical protein
MRTFPTLLLSLCAAATAHVACGKRGDPLPPLRRTPQPVTELAIAQRGRELEVRLQAPRATTEGERLGVVTLELWQATGSGDFQKTAKRRELKAAPGERLVMSDALPEVGTVVRVAAIATSSKRSSVISPLRTLTVAEAVPPPSGLMAALEPDGVRLDFTAPEPMPAWIEPSPEASPSPEPKTSGVLLYRRDESGDYGAPLVDEPLRGAATFLDATATLGTRVCYVARTVVSGAPLIESEASNEACVGVEDKKAPAAPQGVAVLATDAGIEVSWSPSPEPDLALYRVYRHAAGAGPERIAEVRAPETSALDTTAGAGRFVYTVTAVDTAGNESPRSTPVEGGRQ